MKLSHTRETGLTLAHFKGVTVGTKPHRPACWQHISGEGSPTGPQYPTRAEALADTRAFAERTCGYVDPTLAAKGEILDADSASTGTAITRMTPMNRAAHDAKVDLLRIDFNLACRAHADSLQAISDAERVLVETRQVMNIMREAYYGAVTARAHYRQKIKT